MGKTRKMFAVIALLAIVAASVFAAGAQEKPAASAPAATEKKDVIAEPANHDELVELAQQEGKVVVYAITSRFTKLADAFEQKYGIKVEAYNVKDKEIYTKVTTEIGGDIVGADIICAHDTFRVQTLLLDTGYCFTQVPNSLKNIIPAEYQNPLIWQFINKLFVYNAETGSEAPFTNIWGATDPKFKGSIYLKDPNSEAGNFNWLTMLTTEENCAKLEKAYKEYYGKDIVIPEGQTAAHVWISMFLPNTIGNDSETNIAKDVAKKGQSKQWMGWTAYSKFRLLENDSSYSIGAITELDPFAAYLQPYYLMIAKNAAHPYAALLLIEYLFTDEGFSPWSAEVGSYPVIDLAIVDDLKIDFWQKVSISDDGEYLAENRSAIEEFVNNVYYK